MDTDYTVAGEAVRIRPIRLTDANMEAEFVRTLSPLTKHYRFFGGVKELAPAELQRMCDVEGYHSMAFVATVERDGRETQVGVSRYCPNSKAEVRELAVTIADEWQKQGLGTLLMKQLIQSAKDYGIKQLYSIDLADNSAMRELARDAGMSSQRDPNDAN